MTQPFEPMSFREQAQFEAHYLHYLRAREGMPDLATRTLSRREEAARRVAKIAPIRDARLDPAVFARNLRRCEPEPGLDRAMIWALAVAKGNRAERYGVELKLDRRGFDARGADVAITYLELQECYHTRHLLQVLDLVGLPAEIGPPEGELTRAGVRLFARLPPVLVEVLQLAFEVVGIVAFHALREEARALFADRPAILARIDALLSELLVDEVGHVHYLRSRLGKGRLALARTLVPFAKRALFDDNHEIRMLLERRGADDFLNLDIDALVAADADRLTALAA